MSGVECPVRAWLSAPSNLRELRSIVGSFVPSSSVDDVFSATVERMLYRSTIYVGEVERVGAWARSVARTTAINHLNRDFSRRCHEWVDHGEACAPSVLDEIDGEEFDAYVQGELISSVGLTDVERDVFLSMWRGERNGRDNAREMGVNVNTWHGALRRAREKVWAKYEQDQRERDLRVNVSG